MAPAPKKGIKSAVEETLGVTPNQKGVPTPASNETVPTAMCRNLVRGPMEGRMGWKWRRDESATDEIHVISRMRIQHFNDTLSWVGWPRRIADACLWLCVKISSATALITDSKGKRFDLQESAG